MAGIYIHIPFCKQACSYCDFYFVTRQQLRASFLEALLREIHSFRGSRFANETVQTIYFGGGTPSRLSPEQIGQVLQALGGVFDLQTREVTVEMNPDDVTAGYLRGLTDAGVTRASMGVQSFQPELLEFMNRAHSREEALRCLQLLRDSAFDAFTVDLIYGNPGQTQQQLLDDLDLLLQFHPPHLSAYSLTIEPRTRLGKQVDLGRITPPPDREVARHFEVLNQRLAEEGIRRYEVSNYSRPGREAVHNSHYWTHHNYLGLGPGAHSFWWDKEPLRWLNEPDLEAYTADPEASGEKERLTLGQLAEERIMLGLRTREGIGEEDLEHTYRYTLNDAQIEYVQRQQEHGMLVYEEGVLRLTDQGILLADTITLDLLSRQEVAKN